MDEKRRRGIERRGRWHDRLIACLNSPDAAYRLNVAGVLQWSGFEWSNEGPGHEARLRRLRDAIAREPYPAVRVELETAYLALSGKLEEADELMEKCVGFTIGDSLNCIN